MKQFSDDYIPMPGELAAAAEERKQWMIDHPDNRKTYVFDVNVSLLGRVSREEYVAATQAEAVESCIKQWSMVGGYVKEADIKLVEVK